MRKLTGQLAVKESHRVAKMFKVTTCGLDGVGTHIWRYSGGNGIAIRKCAYCLLVEEMKGKWKTVEKERQP